MRGAKVLLVIFSPRNNSANAFTVKWNLTEIEKQKQDNSVMS